VTTQKALAAIKGLTLADCLQFFNEAKDPRAQAIYELCDVEDEGFEIDTVHTSEGEDNGAYMLGWRWVPFSDTALDKETEETEETENNEEDES